MSRLLIVVALLLAVPSAATAAETTAPPSFLAAEGLPARALETEGTFAGACHAALRPNRSGVATSSFRVPSGGALALNVDGRRGDWDVAVFDAAGDLVAADASPDAQEAATGYVLEGGRLTLQACRRSGDTSVPARLSFARVNPRALKSAKASPPKLVSVSTPNRKAKRTLLALGLDMTEHGGKKSLGVVLHGRQDATTLRLAGFRWRTLSDDLVASAARELRPARTAALPGGRTTYRTLADYNNDLKKLAADNPSLVKLITLPEKTYGGKDVLGVEIAEDVAANDGRPAFFNMGVHHAREWPAGELTMEWALELVQGYKRRDARATNVVRNSRNIVVPIVNPDGFEASRNAGELAGQAGGRDETVDDTAYLVAGATTGGEYRRKNCRLPDNSEAGNCTTSVGLAENGVDPNRNYGGLWGGPGADASNVLTQTYRGPGPFSEPETRNIRSVVSRNQVMSLITNHTTAGLVLRAPGLAALGDPVDENKGYKQLGDDMAKHNGYFSQKSFELYDTTGTTEDWSYNATGGFGFTFEIYCGAPNYATGDCDDPAFHPRYQRVVEEWDGTNPTADHTNDPGPNKGFDGKGNREAYYIAVESAINEQRHSVLEGNVPPGTRLRLTKTFKTDTFPQPQPDGSQKPLQVDDKLETIYDVGQTGTFRWHVNPSTRPIVAKATGKEGAGPPSPPETRQGGPAGASDDPSNDGALPGGDADADNPLNYNDHPFTVPAGGDNESVSVRVEWPTPASDYDVKLYEDVNGDGRSQNDEPVVGTSQNGATALEEVSAARPGLQPGKKYVVRVNNFAAVEPYTLTITYVGPLPFKPAQVESYTLTCESGGRVFATQQVQIDRGQVKKLDLRACATAIRRACAASNIGFRSVSAKARRSGLRFGFKRSRNRGVRVDLFQVSTGRRVLNERLVARFKNRKKAFTWNGRKGTDGYYFARFRMKTRGKRNETRRITLRRVNGRFAKRKDFYRRATCDLLPSYKLERPVFGGTRRTPLRIAFQVAARARVQVTVSRGKKAVKRFKAKTYRANRTHRLKLPAGRLKRGDYKVRIVAGRGAGRVTSTLVSRRL